MSADDPTEVVDDEKTVPVDDPSVAAEAETQLTSPESPTLSARSTRVLPSEPSESSPEDKTEVVPGSPASLAATEPAGSVGSKAKAITTVIDPAAAPPGRAEMDVDRLTGERLLGRYLVGEKLGSGGFGSVYAAIDELKQAGGEAGEIAIKIIDSKKIGNRMNALVQEVSRSHQVSHPNIVRVYDIHSDQGLAFITMERLEGLTLADRLTAVGFTNEDRKNRLPIEEVNLLARSACDALSHCHDQDIIHADIKPPNIFLCQNGTVKLLDLGISQLKGSRGSVMGYSASYSSPQQMTGEPADPKDDLFALGCVLYECLIGDRAFAGQTSQAALAADEAADTSVLPRRYRKALGGVLELDRGDRTNAASDLWRQINPAIPKRNRAIAVVAAMTICGFIIAMEVGIFQGTQRIQVSKSEQAAAEVLFQEGAALAVANSSEAMHAFVEAIQTNPYHEEAANELALLVEAAEFSRPQAYNSIWMDFGVAFSAAPNSERLKTVRDVRTDRILDFDLSLLPRSRLLSEYQAPVCVLVNSGYRADELEALRSKLSIRC